MASDPPEKASILSAPSAPNIIPRDECVLRASAFRTLVDGDTKQDGSVTEMLSHSAVIAYVSAFMTLEPGDLIARALRPESGLCTRSRVQIDILGLGILDNHVVAQG